MREKLLEWLVNMALNRRKTVAVVTVVLTVVLGAASDRLEIDTRWQALMPESLPVVKEFNRIDQEFMQPGNMVVAITGPDPVELERVTDEVVDVLERDLVSPPGASVEEVKRTQRYARYIYGRLPEDWLRDHGLRLVRAEDLKRMVDIFRDPRLVPFLSHLNDDLEAEYSDSDQVANQEREVVGVLGAVERLLEDLSAAAMGETPSNGVERVVRDLTIGRPYMFSLDDTMSLVMVGLALPTDEAGELPLVDRRIEALLAPVAARHPEYRIERTGVTAIARDEMDSVGPQTMAITVAAMVLIFVLLSYNFRSVVTPLVALVPIVLGIVWTMGIIALVLGSLNMITSMIMVILLGLGIDFTLHLASRFQEEVGAGRSIREALERSLGGTGKGVLTGGVTTAIAFLTLMVSEMRAIFEFGFCSGVGVLMTIGATFWTLPAILAWRAERWQRKGRTVRPAPEIHLLGSVAAFASRMRYGVVGLAVVITGFGVLAARSLEWEYNLMNLEPANLRSVELQDEIVDKFRLSITTAMVTVGTIEESRRLRKALEARPMVGAVDDVSAWVSGPDYEEARPLIAKLRRAVSRKFPPLPLAERSGTGRVGRGGGDGGRPGGHPAAPASFDSVSAGGMGSADGVVAVARNRATLVEQLDRLWANLVEIQALSFTGGQDGVVERCRRIVGTREQRSAGMLRRLVARLDSGRQVDWQRLDAYVSRFGQVMKAQLEAMTAHDERVTLDMIPEAYRALYLNPTSGRFLVHIMPRKNLYEREELERFRAMTDRIAPNATGTPHLILEMNTQTLIEGERAMAVAVVVILVVLLLDFGRPLLAAIAFLPLLLSLAFTLVVMWLSGDKLHYVNTMALPIIIGIGVDDGVHWLHRFLQEGRGRLRVVTNSVGRAMLMTSLTTMIGFGSLMAFSMRGMQSLGKVLTIGVGWCFVVSITLVPAMATMFEARILGGKNRPNRGGDSS